MRRTLTGLLATLAAVALAFAGVGNSAPAAPRPLGPGGVYDLHVKLFRALDAGDGAAVEKLLGGKTRGLLIDASGKWSEGGDDLRMFLLGPDGAPIETGEAADARKLLLAQDGGADADARWTTRILDGWMDCPSGEVSFATLTFERTGKRDGRTVAQRYRSTSLVSYERGAWKLWHLHVSPAGR
jgi:hypothetical protein